MNDVDHVERTTEVNTKPLMLRFLDKCLAIFVATCDGITSASAFISAIGIVLMAGMVFIDVISRHFGHPIQANDQLAGYAFEAISVLSIAYALRRRTMARVPLGLEKMPNLMRQIVTAIIYVVSIGVVVIFIISCIQTVRSDYQFDVRANDVYTIPLYTIDLIPVIGFTVAGLELLAGLLTFLRTGHDRLYGAHGEAEGELTAIAEMDEEEKDGVL